MNILSKSILFLTAWSLCVLAQRATTIVNPSSITQVGVMSPSTPDGWCTCSLPQAETPCCSNSTLPASYVFVGYGISTPLTEQCSDAENGDDRFFHAKHDRLDLSQSETVLIFPVERAGVYYASEFNAPSNVSAFIDLATNGQDDTLTWGLSWNNGCGESSTTSESNAWYDTAPVCSYNTGCKVKAPDMAGKPVDDIQLLVSYYQSACVAVSPGNFGVQVEMSYLFMAVSY